MNFIVRPFMADAKARHLVHGTLPSLHMLRLLWPFTLLVDKHAGSRVMAIDSRLCQWSDFRPRQNTFLTSSFIYRAGRASSARRSEPWPPHPSRHDNALHIAATSVLHGWHVAPPTISQPWALLQLRSRRHALLTLDITYRARRARQTQPHMTIPQPPSREPGSGWSWRIMWNDG